MKNVKVETTIVEVTDPELIAILEAGGDPWPLYEKNNKVVAEEKIEHCSIFKKVQLWLQNLWYKIRG